MFRDRRDAGRRLGQLVARELRANPNPAAPPIVLGLARGGLPVAHEVAQALGAPLDVLIARKLGDPHQPELGIGAIAEGGGRMLNQRLIDELGVTAEAVTEVTTREAEELERRIRRYRGGRPPRDVNGRTAILVDDGLATGYTARAAIDALRRRGASTVIVAVPVAPPECVADLRGVADAVLALEQPGTFAAIGACYQDFGQTSDAEVAEILEQAVPPARLPTTTRPELP